MKKYFILLTLPILAACGGGTKNNTSLADSVAKTNQTEVGGVDESDSVAAGEQPTSALPHYYIVEPSEYLKDKGVITKQEEFLGMDKIYELNPDFDDDCFTRVDINLLHEVALNGAVKVKLLTKHPADSYKLIKTSAYDKLVILDQKKFWDASNYLVIIAEK